ncbi:YXWGXW repeat-containing protein [Comamonas aquatilis]|uniref:hypothetical protein n=1 Tax=Comamonas aquatilis TaxID=1778406 RepID=UPI0039F06394
MQSVFRTHPSRLLPAVALAAACVALTGCVVAPAYPAYGGDYVSGDVYAPMAPPPLRAEVIPIAPSPAYVWIGGSWGWGGGRYNWNPGRWAMPPRPGYGWHGGGWTHGPRGWQGGGGHWGRR